MPGEAIRAHDELRVFVSSTFVDHFAEREVRPIFDEKVSIQNFDAGKITTRMLHYY